MDIAPPFGIRATSFIRFERHKRSFAFLLVHCGRGCTAARRIGLTADYMGVDRRRTGAPRLTRAQYILPHHDDPSAPPLNSVTFARSAGIARATVIDRLTRRLNSGCDISAMPRSVF